MTRLLLAGAGGFIGSALRYAMSGVVQQWSGSISFPFGTLAVNIFGCLVIGFCSYFVEVRGLLNAEVRAFLLVGILGGFTTYSTFGNETMGLVREGQAGFAFLNVAGHLALGLGAVWAGRALPQWLWG